MVTGERLGEKRSRLRKVGLLAPVAGTLGLRSTQFVVLLALTNLAQPSERPFLVTFFGLLSALGILTDSGATNFLLTQSSSQLSRRLLRRTLTLQASISTLGAVVAFVAALLFFEIPSVVSLIVVASLMSTQVAEANIRSRKALLLVSRRDAAFGAFDLAYAVARALCMALMFVFSSILGVVALPVIAAVAYLALVRITSGYDFGTEPPPRRLEWQVLSVGVGGSVTAFYSQAPIFFAASQLSVVDAAVFAAAARVAQPLEFLPATVASQALPRLRDSPGRWKHFWVAGLGLGLVGALCVAAVIPLLRPLLNMPSTFSLVLGLLLVAFCVKSGNYLLVASVLARGLANIRTAISVAVGLIAVVTAFALSQGGLVALSGAGIIIESTLMLGLLSAHLLSRARRS